MKFTIGLVVVVVVIVIFGLEIDCLSEHSTVARSQQTQRKITGEVSPDISSDGKLSSTFVSVSVLNFCNGASM